MKSGTGLLCATQNEQGEVGGAARALGRKSEVQGDSGGLGLSYVDSVPSQVRITSK